MFTIVGKARKSGVYEGREYDNTTLHCTYNLDPTKGDQEGDGVISIKIKTMYIGDRPLGIGDKFTPYYDRYGNVVAFDVID